MVNYQDGKIYKLVGGGLTYIGSTTQKLSRRKSQHKAQKNYSSRQLIDYDDFDIILIENFPCKTKEELLARERYYIENIECINMQIPTRTRKEYREANKEKLKEYYEKNKEKKKQWDKTYREKNRDKRNELKRKYRLRKKKEKKGKT